MRNYLVLALAATLGLTGCKVGSSVPVAADGGDLPPRAESICSNGADDDDDGFVDFADQDCLRFATDADGDNALADPFRPNCAGSTLPGCDCNDADANVNPSVEGGANALCDHPQYAGADLNCDGVADCAAPEPCESGECCEDANCADGDPCTEDFCSVAFACRHTVPDPRPAACAEPPTGCASDAGCADGDPCTTDRCLVGGVCGHDLVPDCLAECRRDRDCSDDLFCTGVEHCVGGRCQPGIPPSCDDGVGCTEDSCNAGLDRCVNRPEASRCGRLDRCDVLDGCVPAAECEVDADCAGDGLFCTDDHCVRGLCLTSPHDCDDGNPVTADSCDEGPNSCRNVVSCEDAACDNGMFCDGRERCNAAGACVAGVPPSCDDADPNTADSCDEAADLCRHVVPPVPAEVCDGADNDRDGLVDEGFECVRGSAAVCTFIGVDGRPLGGTRICGDRCTIGPCQPPGEVCNNTDDDGDGLVDEGFECVRGSTRSCTFTGVGGRTVVGTQTCSDTCLLGLCVSPAETCNGLDDDADGVTDETYECVQGSRSACTYTWLNGRTVVGTRICSASCALGACTPPVESCGNGVDDNNDGSVDEGCGGGMCVMPRTVRVRVSGGTGSSRWLQGSFEPLHVACVRGWETVRDTSSPFEWASTASAGLHLFNVYDEAGRYVAMTLGVCGDVAVPQLQPGWTVEADAGMGYTTPLSSDAARATLAAGAAAFGRNRAGCPNVFVCTLGSGSCEVNCRDGSDNDGDGLSDRADPDCQDAW